MPRKPFAASVMLAAILLSAAACGGGSNAPSKPGSSPTNSDGSTKSSPGKLQHANGKTDLKNVFAKTPTGKISLYAKSPGHELMEQMYDAKAKTWSAPTTVFKDDTRFCHAIKLKSVNSLYAATLTCSISAQDTGGTQVSYVIASTDGKTWKRMDLKGADGKPDVSPGGKYVAWASDTGFLIYGSSGTFTTVKYTQDAAAPAVPVMQDNGTLLMIKAAPTKDNCTISFLTATPTATTPKAINSTLPQAGHPKCVATSAKMQGTEVIANFTSTAVTKVNSKKATKVTPFAYAFVKLASGKYVIKS